MDKYPSSFSRSPSIPTPTISGSPMVTVPTPTISRSPMVTVPTPTISRSPMVTVPTPTIPRSPMVTVPTPIISRSPMVTVPTPIIPRSPVVTVSSPMVTVPNPIIPRSPVATVSAPIIPRSPTVSRSESVSNNVRFSPEMINENTIIEYANSLDRANYDLLLTHLGNAYHNDTELVSDDIYDELVDIYEAKFGPYTIVGAEPTGNKVQLPYYMGSLRKVKEERELNSWLESYSGPYIIEDKIDGLSILYLSTMENGQKVNKLYTRGGRSGKGKDVSHLLQYVKFPPINIGDAIRGEIVITKEAFARSGSGFKNARAMTSGVVNAQKSFDPVLGRELSFFAYRIMNRAMSAEQDINTLRTMGFNVPNPVAAETLTKKILEDYYRLRQEQAPYGVDGLVIYQNHAQEYPVGEAPRHVIAFKVPTPKVLTTVLSVEWSASKGRRLKPVVIYETADMGEANLNRATGHNARYIIANNIGPGATILVTRQHDATPYVVAIISPAPGGPDYPDPNVFGQYYWNDNGVELLTPNETDQVRVAKLKHFLKTLGIKKTGEKRLELMVAAGIKDIATLLNVTPQQLATVPGIGPGISNQLYTDLRQYLTNVPLPRIMDASNFFPGIGERLFQTLVDAYPNFLDLVQLPKSEIIERIQAVRGFKARADIIAENLPGFVAWLRQLPMITIEQPKPPQPTLQLSINNQGPRLTIQQPQQRGGLSGVTVVFSGFRDRDLEDRVRKAGGRVATSISRNTNMLIMKDLSPNSMKGKAQDAQSLGIPLITKADFIARYL